MSLIKKIATYAIGTKKELIDNQVSGAFWEALPLFQTATGYVLAAATHDTNPTSIALLALGTDGAVRLYNALYQNSPLSGPGIIGTLREIICPVTSSQFRYRRD